MINELMQSGMEQMSDSALIEKRFQLMLSMNQKKWEQKFAEFEQKFQQLSDQVSSQLHKINSQRAQGEAAERQLPNQQPAQQQIRGQQRQPMQEHPRSVGNSEDVSIEKYFYCGSKR